MDDVVWEELDKIMEWKIPNPIIENKWKKCIAWKAEVYFANKYPKLKYHDPFQTRKIKYKIGGEEVKYFPNKRMLIFYVRKNWDYDCWEKYPWKWRERGIRINEKMIKFGIDYKLIIEARSFREHLFITPTALKEVRKKEWIHPRKKRNGLKVFVVPISKIHKDMKKANEVRKFEERGIGFTYCTYQAEQF